MKDTSTWYSGRSPTSFSVSAEHTGLSPKSLRMTGGARGSLLDGYLIMLVVLTVNPALRAKTGRKEERLKYTVHKKCWTWNQRALDVFKLPLPWVRSRLSDLTAAHQDRLSHSGAHFSLHQELPRGARGLGTGGRRTRQDYLTQPHLRTGLSEQKSKMKFLRVLCQDITPKRCKDGPAWGLTSKLWAFQRGGSFRANLYTKTVYAIFVGELKGLFKLWKILWLWPLEKQYSYFDSPK